MKGKKLYIVLFTISIIFLGIGGTFAYLTTSVTATNITQVKAGNLTMTIDGGGSDNVMLFPSKCTSDYAIKKTIKASAVNTSGGKVSFSIGMNITALSNELKRSTMRYALSTSADSCSVGIVAGGDFKDKSVGEDVWLIKNDYDDITQSSNIYTKTYYLYIWLDESETENISSGNISVNMKGSSSNNPNLPVADDYDDGNGTNTLFYQIKSNADKYTRIDFSKTSEASSTNGIYVTTNTENGVPVYYYRGNVDNHVLFANYCWRIVRTTETGGVKLIYDGGPIISNITSIEKNSYTNVVNDTTYPYTFDSTNKTWTSTNKTDSKTGTITFLVDTAGDYILSYAVSSEAGYDKALFYKNGTKLEEHSGTETGTISLIGLTTSDIIKVEYKKDGNGSSGSDTVVFSIGKGAGGLSCNNTGSVTTIGKSAFNSNYKSPASVGYMYGAVYTPSSKTVSSLSGSIVFGNDTTYTNSAYTLKDTYTLTDVGNWSSEISTIASKYHYTCLTSSDTCEKVNYIHQIGNSTFYYFELSSGKNHLDILKEMLDSSTNENNSAIKKTIDNWYNNNMADYTSQLEDTVFCNDRSYDVNKTGWNKDYNNRSNTFLLFDSHQRVLSNYKPTLMCTNANDKFTVEASNGNGSLDYPVGLLTADEIAYAGGRTSTSNSTFYLYNNQTVWALSPSYFNYSNAYEIDLTSTGDLLNYETDGGGYHLVRPSISLKQGTTISGGSGTAEAPFIVE